MTNDKKPARWIFEREIEPDLRGLGFVLVNKGFMFLFWKWSFGYGRP